MKNAHFLACFWSFLNLGWKAAHQTKRFNFIEVFRFFWHPSHPQECKNSGEITVYTFVFEILWQWHHLDFFSLFSKIKPDVYFISFSGIKSENLFILSQKCKNCKMLQQLKVFIWNKSASNVPRCSKGHAEGWSELQFWQIWCDSRGHLGLGSTTLMTKPPKSMQDQIYLGPTFVFHSPSWVLIQPTAWNLWQSSIWAGLKLSSIYSSLSLTIKVVILKIGCY